MKRRELLNVIPFFASLSLRDWEEIEKLIYERHFAKDEFVFLQGAPADTLYIVKSGKVKVLRHSPEGKDIVLRVCSRGKMLGGVGVFDGNGYLASAQTMEPVGTFCISRVDCFKLVNWCPAFAQAVIADLSWRLRGATDLICSLAVDRAEQRIARALLRLAASSGEFTDEGLMIGMALTRQDVADMTGTTVETAIRTMSKFRRQGLIRVRQRRVLLADLKRLESIAHTHWMGSELEIAR